MAIATIVATLDPKGFRVAGRDGGKIVIEEADGTRLRLTEQELNVRLHRDKSPEQRIEELADACSEIGGLIESSADLPPESVDACIAPIVEALINRGVLGAEEEPAKPKGRTGAE
ncbi:hypothetical protein EON81_10705 [bacterium]|nr:MAG: hypothetical protein EON81_10705 [bacterium]